MESNRIRDNKDVIVQGVSFVLGTFLIAICYNLFFLKSDLVVGGTSGLAIIFEELIGFNSNLFIYISSIILIILSYLILGKETTKNTIIGSLLYPLFITLTKPIVTVIEPYFEFEETLVTIILAALVYGLGSGIVYKSGFNTGGMDVLVKMGCKYFHIPDGKALMFFNSLVIIFGGFVFGIDRVIYAIIIIVISSLLVDKILIGISDSKMFLIYTRKVEEIMKIIEGLHTGYTLLPTEGGYSHRKGMMIMCAVSNRDYVKFKEVILEIDPTAFFVINDCYEVNGGVKRPNLPFI